MNINPKDPLLKTNFSDKELFVRFSREANGFPNDAVVSAAANVLLNAIRQKSKTWNEAEKEYNELFGRLKSLLSDHYDYGGRKKGIFPYHQYVNAVKVVDEK